MVYQVHGSTMNILDHCLIEYEIEEWLQLLDLMVDIYVSWGLSDVLVSLILLIAMN